MAEGCVAQGVFRQSVYQLDYFRDDMIVFVLYFDDAYRDSSAILAWFKTCRFC